MLHKILDFGLIAGLSAFVGMTTLGCDGSSGSGGGSAVCDVDFASLAGTYSFKMTNGRTDYNNSCFEDFTTPNPDPATLTSCTWSESVDTETITVELVVEDDGNIGKAKVTSVTNENGEVEDLGIGVNCELLQGEICNAPVRCTFSGDTCVAPEPAPDDWTFNCNCYADGPNNPAGKACQDCKVSYEKYITESTSYCQKERDSTYIEFTLNVK